MANLPAYENVQFSVIQIDTTTGERKDEAWLQVQAATSDMLTPWGVEQLRAGLDPHVKTVLVETPYVCEDFRSLHQNFYGRKFRERPSKCCRLHFFNEHLSESEVVFAFPREHYIGFSVVEPLMVRCIGRTVIRPEMIGLGPEHFHLLGTRFRNRVGGTLYECNGFPYRSQSNEATVCAHVTMWAVCRYLSHKFDRYRKHLPYELIEMAGRRNGRIIPHRGLNYADYAEMLDRFGCHPIIVTNHGLGSQIFASKEDGIQDQQAFNDFLKILYCYIESGFPLIASFSEHVVSIVGHASLDQDVTRERVSKLNGPIHAAELVDEYVVMDDAYFPYQLMPRTKTQQQNYRRALDEVRRIVVPLPDEAYLRPTDVDNYVLDFLEDKVFEPMVTETLQDLELNEPIVYRPLLATGVSFKQFKQRELADKPTDLAIRMQLALSLPRFVWCVEMSTPSLRTKDEAFGEILLDATAGESDLEPIFIRIGSKIARSTITGEDTRLDYFDRNPYSSFAQYRHNLGASPRHA
ncbi:hypothetical protein [Crateriforma conspicua]|uniref:hypothetical protein n=1 Tax=Crateriforma conspicua TaxID=2527996 RepID=UPI00118A4607|nr:hypothetical protein [Crateriforma conspicua]QDV62646.1 hypothetical protein Mal65_17800 [Crateriforma conspicua]